MRERDHAQTITTTGRIERHQLGGGALTVMEEGLNCEQAQQVSFKTKELRGNGMGR